MACLAGACLCCCAEGAFVSSAMFQRFRALTRRVVWRRNLLRLRSYGTSTPFLHRLLPISDLLRLDLHLLCHAMCMALACKLGHIYALHDCDDFLFHILMCCVHCHRVISIDETILEEYTREPLG